MKLAEIFAKHFYRDVANVYRAIEVKVGDTDDYAREYKLIYADLPCHLSQYGPALSAHRDDMSMQVTTDLRLNYSPDIHIADNDVIKVKRRGVEWELIAANEFSYSSHNCCSVRRRKRA